MKPASANGNTGDDRMHVAICIATFRRPNLLGKLLQGIAEQTFEKSAQPDIQVVVVDNDPKRSAEEMSHGVPLPWPLLYVNEVKRGIASARNRALREARGSDCIVFIDDDEVPTPAWLDELLWTRSTFDADVVVGPVLPVYTPDVPEWIKRGKYFNRPVYPTGEALDCCATNNTLILRRVLDRIPAFDEQFELSGGEDTHFFMRAHRAGFTIRFSREAVVTEAIAGNRASLTSMLQRAYRGGNCFAFVERALDDRFLVRLARFAKGWFKIAHGLVRVVIAAAKGRIAAVWGLCGIFTGAGMLAGLLGLRYQPYRAVSGDAVE